MSRRYRSNVLLWEKTAGSYRPTEYADVRKQIHQFAAGLLELGIQKGDRVALLSEGRNAWVVAELAVLYLGAICVPLSVKLEARSELRFRLEHSGCKMVLTSTLQFPKIAAIRDQLPGIETIVVIDRSEPGDGQSSVSWGDVMDRGRLHLTAHPDAIENRWPEVSESDPATISYTSGTTADPKGIILTHRNYTANVDQCARALDILPSYRSVLILPWDHSFTHTAGIYLIIASGASLASVEPGRTTAETLRNIPVNIREIRPTFLFSVPALARNFRKNIETGVRQKGALVSWLFASGLKVAYSYNQDGYNKGRSWRRLLRPVLAVYDAVVFKKIRQALGGEMEFFIGGGALLDTEIQRFFYAIGIPMLQGYGLTEAAPVISCNVPKKKHKLGSSGHIVPDLQVQIRDEDGNPLQRGVSGQIVVKGENVMAGYWKNPKATREAIVDGWLLTGDLGRLDEDDFLYVLGRVKSLLIGSDGEKFSPEGIEEAMVAHSSYIDQVMLYNSQSPYTAALLVPNKAAITIWLSERHMSADDPAALRSVIDLIAGEIDSYRQGGRLEGIFPTRWLPSTFAVLSEGFTEQNQLLNATLKMVRTRIVEEYRTRLDSLFTAEGKRPDNRDNLEALRQLLSS